MSQTNPRRPSITEVNRMTKEDLKKTLKEILKFMDETENDAENTEEAPNVAGLLQTILVRKSEKSGQKKPS